MSLWPLARDRRLRGLPDARSVALAASGGNDLVFVRSLGMWAYRGTLIPRPYLENEYEVLLTRASRLIADTASALRAGRISPLEMRRRVVPIITDIHWDAALIPFGPRESMSLAARVETERLLDEQLRYLANVEREVALGAQPRDGTLRVRLEMYASAGWAALQSLYRVWASGNRYQYEENILGVAEHCEGCIAETARGRVPIGTLVPIGQRDCLSNCHCRLAFS